MFTEYLRLQHDITHSEEVDEQERLILQKLKDMITLTKTMRGLPGHESAKFHVVDYDLETESVRKFWSIVVPVYRLSDDKANGQRPTLNLASIKLLGASDKEESAGDVLSTEDFERMLQILVSHIMRILGSDCVPVVMRPVVTENLRRYIEPLTRLGKWDSIEFPPVVEGQEKPRFRLLGLSNRDIRRLGWVREGEFGWNHIQEQESTDNGTNDK